LNNVYHCTIVLLCSAEKKTPPIRSNDDIEDYIIENNINFTSPGVNIMRVYSLKFVFQDIKINK